MGTRKDKNVRSSSIQSIFSSTNFLTSSQLALDASISQFSHEVMQSTSILAMTSGGLAYRLGKVASLSLLGSFSSGPLRFLPQLLSPLVGLACEVTAFESTSLLLSPHSSHLTPHTFWKSWRNSFVQFGIMKGMGHYLQTQNILFQHGVQDLSMVAGERMIAALAWTSNPQGDFLHQMLHAEWVNNQLSIGNRLAGHFTGHRLQGLEQSLEQSWLLKNLRPTEEVNFGRHAAIMSSRGEVFVSFEELTRRSEVALRELFKIVPEGEVYVTGLLPIIRLFGRSFPDFFQFVPRYPEWIVMADFASDSVRHISDKALATVEYRFFLHFLLSRSLRSPKYFQRQVILSSFPQLMNELYREFQEERAHLQNLSRALQDIAEYRVRVMNSSLNEKEIYRNMQLFFVFYHARRILAPNEPQPISVNESLKRMRHEGVEISAGNAALIGCYVDFVSAKIAADDRWMKDHHKFVVRDFPLSEAFWRCAQTDPINRVAFDDYVRSNLPPRNSNERPLLVIVGIGPDSDLIESYARQGYDLLLVDRRSTLIEILQPHIARVQEQSGANISFACEDVYNPSDDFIHEWRHRADMILYANVNININFGSDHPFILKLLKEQGLFVQCHPDEIRRDSLLENGFFTTLVNRKWIRAFLGTPSERLAYPTGVHLLVAKRGQIN